MLADDLERLMSFRLPTIWLLLFWVERPTVAVDVVKDGVLDASKVEPTVQHCPTVILVSLPETGVLMQLSQDLSGTFRLRLADVRDRESPGWCDLAFMESSPRL